MGLREIAQCLRTLSGFPKDPGSTPSTHVAAHDNLQLQSQEDLVLSVASAGTRYAHGIQTQMREEYPYT